MESASLTQGDNFFQVVLGEFLRPWVFKEEKIGHKEHKEIKEKLTDIIS